MPFNTFTNGGHDEYAVPFFQNGLLSAKVHLSNFDALRFLCQNTLLFRARDAMV